MGEWLNPSQYLDPRLHAQALRRRAAFYRRTARELQGEDADGRRWALVGAAECVAWARELEELAGPVRRRRDAGAA